MVWQLFNSPCQAHQSIDFGPSWKSRHRYDTVLKQSVAAAALLESERAVWPHLLLGQLPQVLQTATSSFVITAKTKAQMATKTGQPLQALQLS